MITEIDKQTILRIARKYGVTKILLFGSSLSDMGEAHDIDLAVEGVADEDFFAFYGELICALSKPVDVVDLSRKTKFSELVQQEGLPLHA